MILVPGVRSIDGYACRVSSVSAPETFKQGVFERMDKGRPFGTIVGLNLRVCH